MTPPSAKPEASKTEIAAAEPAAEATPGSGGGAGQETPAGGGGAGQETPAGGAVTRLATTGRLRAAALELRMARMAHNRAAGEAETAVRPAAPVPVRANGMPRLGPKARALAAKAALAKAGAGDVAPRPVRGPAAGPKSSQAVVFASVRGPRRVVEAPSLKMAEGDVAPGAVPVPAPTPVVTDDDPGSRSGVGPRAEKRLDRAAKANDASNYVVAPTVNPAQLRPRHYGVIALFVLCVIVPTLSYSWYLWTRAADQYESDVGFGSRTEEAPSTFDFLGALGGSAQSGSKDMDILNQFIISQELVAKIDTDLDLKAIWSKAGDDPLNGFYAAGTIEDLVAYWQRMVLVNYDNGTGLMNLQVFAFDPVDAQKIASAVLTESTNIINQLSKTAQDDTTRYSKESLAATEAKLAEARLAVLDFQVRNNIVDPSNVVANQLSVVATLNQQLASTQIDFDMLSGTVPATDPRLAQLSRRLEVIRNRIAEEQAKVGDTADSTSPGFAELMADFERLKVEQDFAQAAYLSALAAHDQALTDARQKTRYLAAYVAPTLAEAPTAPNRPLTAALTALIGFLIWSVLVLTYYALRDRR